MDSISHILFGFVLGHALRLDKKERIILIITCVLPDFDAISLVNGWEAFFQFHRGPLHSFFFAVLASLAIGIVYISLVRVQQRTFFPVKKFLLIVLICLAGLFSHLFLDLCTPWTTHVLWPFSNEQITLDLTSFFDPLFLAAIFLASAFIAYTKNAKKVQMVAVAALLLIAVDFGVRYYEKGAAVQTVKGIYGYTTEVMSVPTYRPDRWWVVLTTPYEDGYTYELYYVDSIHKTIVNSLTMESSFIHYDGLVEPPIDSPQEAVAYSKRDEKVKAFIEKSRLPAVDVTFDQGVWHVFWYDAFSEVSGRVSQGIVADVGTDGTLTVSLSLGDPFNRDETGC